MYLRDVAAFSKLDGLAEEDPWMSRLKIASSTR